MSFAPDIAEFAFAPEHAAEIERIMARYPAPRKQSAVMPLLHLAQKQHGGWLPRAILDHVAELLEIPKIRVYEVASFYDMYNTLPTGRIQVRVCTTTPCWLCGADDVVRAAKDVLGVGIGDSTPDGRFFLREFECLGACCNAPMMWIDDDYYEDLDYAKTTAILEAFARGERPRPGPQSGRKGSEPLGVRHTLVDHAAPPARQGRPVDPAPEPTDAAAAPGTTTTDG